MKPLILSNFDPLADEVIYSNDRGSWNVTRALRDCNAGKHKRWSLTCALPGGTEYGSPQWAHDRPAGDRRLASDYRHLYSHRLSRPISAAACWLADLSGANGWRWPHDPQRSGLAARSTVAAVTVPVWSH